MKDLVNKYNVPGPRYTSYPTVPFWKKDDLTQWEWLESLNKNVTHFKDNSASVYVHLPYCESLCTFCGCHKRITKNHAVEQPYIDAVVKEWQLYLEQLSSQPEIKELHFGGGTPTFFSPDLLVELVEKLFNVKAVNPEEVELSFEAHPNNTSEEHLQKLYDFGFRRLSLGIQSYSPTVQQAIHRIQPFEQVKTVHDLAKQIGYFSISHDLVFGLPKQQMQDMIDTVEKTLSLKPDRISLYSYAHVPWIKGNGQRGYSEEDLPAPTEKRALYETSKQLLLDAGYLEVGMDHFALPHDSLAQAFLAKNLHRNFMGYTTQNTNMMIGLGMSAISDSWFGFAQNDKSVEGYLEQINNNQIPVFRGHLLNEEELMIRRQILDLMCHFETTLNPTQFDFNTGVKARLQEMIEDQLVEIEDNTVRITEAGIPFVRNCCMAFDLDLIGKQQEEQLFSKTI